MNANINQNELKVLAALHENSKGYGDGFALPAEAIRQYIHLEPEGMSKATSFLSGFGLVFARSQGRDPKGGYMLYREMYLTSLGENYMRELEEQLNKDGETAGKSTKLTLKVVQEGWSVVKAVAIAVLGDYVKRQI